MITLAHHVTTEVRSIRRETDRIVAFELADPDNWELPPFTAGAHIDVYLPSGLVRPYSLCGSPSEANRYWIAVQREPNGRGGSIAIHEQLTVGATVSVSLPRNHFPLSPKARHHKMIAGGIGITPFIPMIDTLLRDGASFELHYCARTPEQTAFSEWLRGLPARDHVHFYHDETSTPNPIDLKALLTSGEPGEHVYGCGPAGLVNALLSAAEHREPGTVHVELFGNAAAAVGAETAFVVELAQSKKTIEVAVGETILEALRRADVPIEASCEAGACLQCKTRYLDGAPLHRDLVMSAADRRQFMTPCVSSCLSERLVLDL